MNHNLINIGTSGWHYDHWEENFYPEATGKNKRLEYYSNHLKTVEINNTFYQLPARSTLENWRAIVPDDFIFSVKGSRYITHMKKLKDPAESSRKLFERIESLGDKLGPVLFQLPPHWRFNAERLEQFLDALPDKYKYALEFRDHSWLCDEAYEILRRRNAAFCIYHLEGFLTEKIITADFIYIRLHGPAANAYEGEYTKQELAAWAGAISTWSDQGKEVYCYFDNDQNGYAARNALELNNMLNN
jgi:uncharacterized protein YecE (DUF72 family)